MRVLQAVLSRAPVIAPAMVAAAVPALFAGCAAPDHASLATELRQFSLADAPSVEPTALARARPDYDRPLPEHLTQRLCEEFTLVTVTRPSDFSALRRRLGLPADLPTPDFSRGSVIGLLAEVGEPANDVWPVRIRTAMARDGEGGIEAEFAPGLYYPIVTAGFLDLVYIPGLSSVRIVKVNQRTFLLRPAGSAELTAHRPG